MDSEDRDEGFKPSTRASLRQAFGQRCHPSMTAPWALEDLGVSPRCLINISMGVIKSVPPLLPQPHKLNARGGRPRIGVLEKLQPTVEKRDS